MFKRILNYLKSSENRWLIVGWMFVFVAVLTPTVLLIKLNSSLNLEQFGSLGSIGDFLGGTTVGLLSLTSIVFVVATISMQKKELALQRKELTMQKDELKKTREEFELSNKTLLKQQFENTFFNMINLHHNILKDLKLEKNEKVFSGRYVFEQQYEQLKRLYNNVIKQDFFNEKIHQLVNSEEIKKINQITKILYLKEKRDEVFDLLEENISSYTYYDQYDEIQIDSRYYEAEDKIYNETDTYWLKIKKDAETYFENNMKNNREVCRDYLLTTKRMFDYVLKEQESNKLSKDFFFDDTTINFLLEFKKNFLLSPLKRLKNNAYEFMYDRNEEVIGHYFRNLYRIIKFIQDEKFSADIEENELEQRKYRGILRAQLSSIELLMLFYNITYSEKGKKFSDLILNKNFFDDHLVKSKFLWTNDSQELRKIN